MISVIIPTHNRLKLLKEALNSVLKQSHHNLEVLVVANNCTDNTVDYLLYHEDHRVIPIIIKEAIGAAQARNIGMEKSNGDYLAFLDDDDLWSPDKLEKVLDVFKDNSETPIVSTGYYEIESPTSQQHLKSKFIYSEDLLYKNVLGSFSFCVVNKTYLKKHKIAPKLKACQDWDLWLKILLSSGKPAYRLGEALVGYRSDSGGPRLSLQYKQVCYSYAQFIQFHKGNMSLRQKKHHALLLHARRDRYRKVSLSQAICRSISYFLTVRRYQRLEIEILLYGIIKKFL